MRYTYVRENPVFRFLFVVLIPLAILAYVHFGTDPYYETVFVLFLVNIIPCAALNLTNGITGIFSLGQAAFMALGAYISSLLTLEPKTKFAYMPQIPEWLGNAHFPFWAAMLAACVITSLIAVVIGFTILRAKGHYLAVITLGMVIVVKSLLDNASNLTNGSRGISGMEKYTTMPVALLCVIITLYVLYRIRISAFGRSMIALRDDEDAAASLGIRHLQIRLLSFVVSAFFAAAGGCLWAHLERVIAPSLFYFDETFTILEMSVIGGMATLSGAIPGAAILTFIPQVLADLSNGFTIFGITVPKISGLSSIVMSIVFILVIIFRRGGVTGNSEYIVESMFSLDTYTGLFRKSTYADLKQSLLNIGKRNRQPANEESVKEDRK